MKQKYCLPILKNKTTEVLKIISKNRTLYDFFEVWLDYIKDLNLDFVETLIKRFDGKIIFLFRRQSLESPKMSFQKRKEIMDAIFKTDCYLDLDISQKKELEYLTKNFNKVRLIVSYHNYNETPADEKLKEIISLMKKYKPYIYKISAFCNTDSDAYRIMDFLTILKEERLKYIILGMGKNGIITRIAGALLGNEINFSPMSLEDKSASGQLTKPHLENILKNIRVCYFVADPVEHSMSPQVHEAGYKALGLEHDFIFLRKRVSPQNLKKFIAGVRKDSHFRGASISIPHKVKIIKYLDGIDKVAKVIGAVNTIVKNGKKIKGYNTDYLGVLNPLKQLTNLKSKKVAVLGAGGAARATVYALVTSGAMVTVFNRNVERGEELARDFNCDYDSLKNITKVSNFDIVINATNVGLRPSDSPLLSKKMIKPNQIIFDVVYSMDHPQTKLIKQAVEQKAKVISGIDMLIFQGIEQFKLFTNKNISVEVMRRAL